jgi:hypothetical protein
MGAGNGTQDQDISIETQHVLLYERLDSHFTAASGFSLLSLLIFGLLRDLYNHW